MSVLDGRSATLNVEGWCYDVAVPICNDQYTIRTPWYTDPTFDLVDGKQALEEIKYLKSYKHHFSDYADNPEECFQGMSWISFDYHQPIGVHLGAFAIYRGWQHNPEELFIYIKILKGDGEVGCIACSTKDINKKHLELL